MDVSADRPEFAPPAARGLTGAIGLAVLAHLLLAAGLAFTLRWKTQADNAVAEAELWSRLPQLQAPRVEETTPPPPPPPPPVARVTPPPPPPTVSNADIVRERERKQQLLEKQRQDEERREEQARREALKKAEAAKQAAADKKRQQTEQAARDAREKEQERQRKDQQARREQELKALQDAKRTEDQRKANLERLAGLAGSSGPATATGTATRASGPSAGYGSRVAAKVRPNIVFTEDLPANPEAVVEVRAGLDGSILSRRLVRSSGAKAWDEAVLRAIDKTETLPRDTDGSVPSVIEMRFRPRD